MLSPRATRTTSVVVALASALALRAGQSLPPRLASDVRLPFQFLNRHIVLPVSVNGSSPLSFVLDTGNKYAVLDIERARSLGLTLGQTVAVKGTSSESATGAFISGARFAIPGFADYGRPIPLAIPLRSLSARQGHDFDGLLGADFLREFVVEVDMAHRVLVLHDQGSFTYHGPGASLTLSFNRAEHPLIEATVTPVGRAPVTGKIVVDLGSSLGVALNQPFVVANHLPGTAPSIALIGVGGVGGDTTGRLGRLAAISIGPYTLVRPATMFSMDKAGAHADADTLGSVGNAVLEQFTIFLDYARDRMIIEPNADFGSSLERASSGAALVAEGADYRTFRVTAVSEASPAAEAGLATDDVIARINGEAASAWTLDRLTRAFEQPGKFELVVARKGVERGLRLVTRVLY